MTTGITCHGMTKSYGENVVLKDLDFWVDAGELVTLVSPSGGGKTTLLNILGGLTTADQGVVEVAGQDLSQLDEDGRAGLRRHAIGIVHQSSYLFPWLSVNENLEIAPGSRAPAPWLAEVRLLDEPTTGLDDHLASCVRRALRGLADRGCAVVVATHEEATSAVAERAIALRGRRTIL